MIKTLMKFENQAVNMPGSFRWFSGSIVQADNRICVTRSTRVENRMGRSRILAEYPDKYCNAMAQWIVKQAPYFKNQNDQKVEGRILI